eukprot:TRINITY_DN2073_c0_g1_i1.p1 TRINITY_DN2073_c0_g1~~TRINITY_DN2073_c0_g1_i1.p1  ORF type:complete len:228 (+),score=98.94 TRINITY_DN2073_c0_g1_i1:68-685(+)
MCCMVITATGFLWHMVRCIMGVLFLVGEHLESPQVVTQLLDVDATPRKPNYEMAPELPLVLHDCHYPNLTFPVDTALLEKVQAAFYEEWKHLQVQAMLVRDVLASVSALLPPPTAAAAATPPPRHHTPLAQRGQGLTLDEKRCALSAGKRRRMVNGAAAAAVAAATAAAATAHAGTHTTTAEKNAAPEAPGAKPQRDKDDSDEAE